MWRGRGEIVCIEGDVEDCRDGEEDREKGR